MTDTCTCPACNKPEADCECEAPFCGECNKPCEVKWEDFGIGSYEYCGAPGVDVDVRAVSVCCEGDLFEDAQLTKPFTVDPVEEEYD